MRLTKVVALLFFAAVLCAPFVFNNNVEGQAATEAPAAFDGLTNGVVAQGTPPEDEPVPLASFEDDKAIFDEQEEIDEGLGPVYNALSCGNCHQNPVSGGTSQILEVRAGHFDGVNFIDHPGDSLIHSRAINAEIQEHIFGGFEDVVTFRSSLNVLGDGFVEALSNNTLIANANAQPAAQRGTILNVPVLEDSGNTRVGRFGHKNQHASLISFSADAYLNEMGITSPLQPTENTSNGASVAAFDEVADPEDDGLDIEAFAEFMRSTKAPPRGPTANSTDAVAGSNLFNQIGCAVCHTRNFTTAPTGTVINGGAFVVPAALGNKVFHPFGDFLLHNIGTGDGIVQNGGQATRNQVRTAPLWGLRTHNRFMHDGAQVTFTSAILRHAGQATASRNAFQALSAANRARVIVFLLSL